MSLLKEIAFHFDPPPIPINNADILFFIFFFGHLVKLMSEFSTELFILYIMSIPESLIPFRNFRPYYQ